MSHKNGSDSAWDLIAIVCVTVLLVEVSYAPLWVRVLVLVACTVGLIWVLAQAVKLFRSRR